MAPKKGQANNGPGRLLRFLSVLRWSARKNTTTADVKRYAQLTGEVHVSSSRRVIFTDQREGEKEAHCAPEASNERGAREERQAEGAWRHSLYYPSPPP
jgi:hypothetical protein